MSAESQPSAESVEQQHFQEAQLVTELLERYKRRRVSHAILGGFALDAIRGDPYKPGRGQRKSLRDLDVMILKYTDETLKNFRSDLSDLQKSGRLKVLEVSINVASRPEYRNRFQMSTRFKQRANGGYAFVFRDLEEPMPDNFTQVEQRSLKLSGKEGALVIDTFGPAMNIACYMTRVGFMKPKNISKLKEFTEKVLADGFITEDELEKQLKPFEEFCKKMHKKYPTHYAFMVMGVFIDDYVFQSSIWNILPSPLRRMFLRI
ncbi:MAG: hypothetical protein AAB573_00990 [Patescibacteria group bacterium]